jgi:hypothetical protein
MKNKNRINSFIESLEKQNFNTQKIAALVYYFQDVFNF